MIYVIIQLNIPDSYDSYDKCEPGLSAALLWKESHYKETFRKGIVLVIWSFANALITIIIIFVFWAVSKDEL